MEEEEDERNPKSVLNEWFQKQKILPTGNYNVRQAGMRGKAPPRFLCELIVPGFPYVGMGNSLNKKDAEKNAAKDFIQFLIRTEQMIEAEAEVSSGEAVQARVLTPQGGGHPLPGLMQGYQGQGQGPSGRGRGGYGQGQGIGPAYRRQDGQIPFQMMDAKKVADAEDLDVNAGIHGNWTIENAKGRLHQFLQMNKIQTDYYYNPIGPDHSRSFRATMGFYVSQLGRKIQASETGSTKQTASKSCALSLVRQLYHLGVIEAYTGTLKRPKESETVKPYSISLDPSLMEKVYGLLVEIGITPKRIDNNLLLPPNQEGISLFPEEVGRPDVKYDAGESGSQCIVSWSPPQPNWNPWTGCNIDEGYMATAPLEQLSSEFLESYKIHQQTSTHVQKMVQIRSQLPVFQKRPEILDAIGEHPVVLIKGETGSGKTTQICQFILDDYLMSEQGAFCNVIITQPRRISAISIAERIANERGEDLGQSVGYSVRFESCLPRPYGAVLFCTVGVLLRKLEGGLRGVSHVIVDEIHERDVNTDFLLIVLRDMLSIYPDLRVILMSATIDTALFTDYFNGCPVIEIEGRAFPVDTYFLEDVVEILKFQPSQDYIKRLKKKEKESRGDGDETLTSGKEDNLNILRPGQYSSQTVQAMSQMSENDINYDLISALLQHIKGTQIKGAVLIFLPGWNNIFSLLKYLQGHATFGNSSTYVLLPLHSQLPREDQHRVFESVGPHQTKIILATNIAETSITIDDVVFVIDSARSKIKLFTSHNNMTTFATVWASKSNLMQRKGRAGRVQQGVCYHLCSRARFEALEDNMVPEMLRTPLHEIALSIKLLRLGGIGHFLSKAPDPPAIDAVIEAQVLLTELNCLDEHSELTQLGRVVARLPVDPRLGKMIILGTIFNCADPLAIIAAQSSNLSEVFVLGPENKRLAPTQRAFAAYRNSDHFAILNAFQQWERERERNGEQGEFDFCNQRMLSLSSLKVTRDAKNQLLQVLLQSGFPEEQVLPLQIRFKDETPVLDVVAGLLCTGLYPNVCYHLDKRKVLTTESKPALVHKASVNCSRFEINFPYPFFIFGEKIRSRAVSCKTMTMISPINLLLFGSKKVEYLPSQGLVRLDNWINLDMSGNDVSAILGLRPVIENMVTRVVENPEAFFPLQDQDLRTVNLVTELCRMKYDPQQGQGQGQGQSMMNVGLEGHGQRGVKRPNEEIDDQSEIGDWPAKRPSYARGPSSFNFRPRSMIGGGGFRYPQQPGRGNGSGPRFGNPNPRGWTPIPRMSGNGNRGYGYGHRGFRFRGGFRRP